ncbi:flagellar motor protein MotB [Neptuniibacter sp. CAU 1671]|uniref:flagellar motor protein MotB n=1 Tax=Neptuniibacter sp. CAU 1671 TaxID=3032593 RepID=UPI0023DB1E19|nr:flagellar motor protein MotB [Neptuniibacter sp. CAU 1671]MDF2181687.1 flagellar motor protein MotB [Neptuniibacter sp. CAU 1671]
MSDDTEHECPPCPPGLPAWLATFGDLMSLLMCFFVLLLSFSEMDVLKFKQLAGSMREAFGVQNQIKVEDIPKGTSIIAQEFSPGRPEPTPLNEIRQMTINNDMNTLDIRSKIDEADIKDKLQEQLEQLQEMMEQEARQEAVEFATALAREIGDGSVEVETDGKKIIIRIKEKGSFDSGSADLRYESIPVLAKIRDVLLEVKGRVDIEGHSDNIPYSGQEFESNWDLSAARALAVAHELFADSRMDQARFRIMGYADTKPLVPNTTRDNRARNRRVEIIVQKGSDQESLEKIEATQPDDPDAELLDLKPQDIF